MILQLAQVPATALGIYPLVGGHPNRTPAGRLPDRARFLHPQALPSFLELGVRCSDMLRSASESLHAIQTKSGVQPPSRSGHNYGLSIDIDVDDELHRRGIDKPALDAWMAEHGWYCHRTDHAGGSESWHYNHFGTGDDAARYLAACEEGARSTAAGLEAMVLELYGPQFVLDDKAVQAALATLGFYSGDVDGTFGARTRSAIRQFRVAWGLGDLGELDTRAMRTLAFVTATREVANG